MAERFLPFWIIFQHIINILEQIVTVNEAAFVILNAVSLKPLILATERARGPGCFLGQQRPPLQSGFCPYYSLE